MASDVEFHELFVEPTKNGLTRPKRVRGSGVYMVNMGELFAHRRIGAIKMDRVPLSSNENSFLLNPGDLLFARQSLVLSGAGQCSLFMGHKEPVTFESHLIRCRVDKAKADPRFLFYFFGSPAGRAALEPIIQQGAGASGLRASDLAKISLPNVPREEQSAIANVLSDLDDRIDHNRALAANLEAIARALFKSWFVDFDPVRAKAAGETPPGLAPDLAALFPDRFVDSELGEIPEGWANKAIGDVLAVLETGRRPKGGVKGIREGVPSVGAESINGIGQFDFSQTKYVPHEFFDKLKTGKPQSFDTLLYKDGGKPGDFRPRIGMYGCGFPFDEYALNEHVFMLRADTARVGSFYLYFWMARDETMHILQNAGGKAAIPGINRQDVMTLPVQLPPMTLVGAFERIVAPLVERILTAQKESQRMAGLRDLLLPRLISRKLRVEDAEAALEAA